MVGDIAIKLDDQTAALGAKATGKIELGIRPLYLEVHQTQVEASVPVIVKSIEDQGNYKIVTTIFGNNNILRARLPEGKPSPSEKAWLRFSENWIKLYSDDILLKN
jgi:glycerol transport system ATP-binding protein